MGLKNHRRLWILNIALMINLYGVFEYQKANAGSASSINSDFHYLPEAALDFQIMSKSIDPINSVDTPKIRGVSESYPDKHADKHPETLKPSHITPSSFTTGCTIDVLPNDAEDLLARLTNSEAGCTLRLSGVYRIDDTIIVNHTLTAGSSTIASDFDNIWNRPQRLTESGLALYTCTYAENPLDGEKLSGLLPAAVLVIESGIISVSSQGGLRNLGIYDNRPAPVTETPVLYLSEPPEHQVTGMFQEVLFNRSYPLVSDITENHPYWNNVEPADPIGNMVRNIVRGALTRVGVGGSRGSRSLSSGTARWNSNDKGDDDPNREKKPSAGTNAYKGWERKTVWRDRLRLALRFTAAISAGILIGNFWGLITTRNDDAIFRIRNDLDNARRRIQALEKERKK